ncbi:hypothetical protein SLS59_005663 [Nothophoma quercina]|uniref:Methyltransferase domain-containing protein n=1 Tax=Nothophoma quercina TaxID=749835 RepID=A0ABR3R9H1_9PLEO
MFHFFMTILEVIFVERRPSLLFDLTKLRYKSFARLWTKNGEEMSIEMPGPLTELLSACEGVVLDIGPGSGEILSRFDADRITAMYGAEPAEDLHKGLLRNAQKKGFGDKYHALLCGAEPESLIPALHKSGILQETINGLYSLLKPGGRMIICEHVVNPWRTEGRILARFMQFVHTPDFLDIAGDWDKFELKYYGSKDVILFVVGELIKKGGKSYAEVVKK